ncbi:MAG: isochorismatase family cysteine hydrolase [Candidatus Limnocylindria bacterium]
MTDTERELALEGTVFRLLPEFPIIPERTALLTIDMQYLDAHPDHGLGQRAKEAGKFELLRPFFEDVVKVIPNIQRLQGAARRAGVEVIHVRIVPTTEDARDCPAVTRLRKLRYPRSSHEGDILEELRPEGDEISLTKITSSAFTSTPLAMILHNIGIDTIMCCGVITNGCVESTVREGRDLGFLPVVVSDACATWTREMHERSLRFMAGSFGNVRSTADLVAVLEAASPEPALSR